MDKILILSLICLSIGRSASGLEPMTWSKFCEGHFCKDSKHGTETVPDGGNDFTAKLERFDMDKFAQTNVTVCHNGANIHAAQAICRQFDAGDAKTFSEGNTVYAKSTRKNGWTIETKLVSLRCSKYQKKINNCVMDFSPNNAKQCQELKVFCWKTRCDNKDNVVYQGYPRYRYGQICHKQGANCTRECFRCPPGSRYGDGYNGKLCMTANSDAAADVTWEPHFMTIDGKHFDFQGKCSYTLLKKAELRVIGKYAVCGKFGVTCLQSLIIETPNTILELGPRKQFFIVDQNDRITTRKPFCNDELCFYEASDLHDAVDIFDQVKIFWDRKAEASFVLDPINMGMVSGLLGNFNGNPDDDFTKPDGTLAKDAVEFGNSWMVEGSCDKTVKGSASGADPKIPPSAREGAEKICKILMSDVFKSCNISKTTAFNNCILDVATCNKANISDCLCPSLEEYDEECEEAKQDIKAWRNHVPQCRDACPPGQEFQSCGNPCESTCERMKMDRVPCIKACVEGCNCPKGQTKDKDNKCISVASCLGSVEKREWKRVLVN